MRPGQASRTARVIAAATVLARQDGMAPGPSDEAVEISRDLLRGSLLLVLLDSRPGRALLRLVERLVAPNLTRHFMRRKAWIARAWADAADRGFGRLVQVAAGFDGLALRVARERPDLVAIEVDHPSTQLVKRGLLRGAPANLRFVGADLSREGFAGAVGAALRDGAGAVVVIEGLLMYLTREAAARVVADAASLPAPALRVVLTFMERREGEAASFGAGGALTGWWLRRAGEPFLWSASRGEMRELLARAGLGVVAMLDERDLADVWPGPRLEGEVLVLAERSGPGPR